MKRTGKGNAMSKTVILGMETRKMAYDPELVPEAYIDSGDTVIFESEDANCSLIRTEEEPRIGVPPNRSAAR